MRVIIVGGGEVGRELAKLLVHRRSAEITLIDHSEPRAEALSGELDALVIHGDGTHPDVLRSARVREAGALVAATGSDSTNLVVAMLARQHSVPIVVLRLEELALRPAAEALGIAEIVSAKRAAASVMLRALRGQHHVDFSLISRGGVDMVELPGDRLAGRMVRDCDMGPHTLLVAIRRQEEQVLLAKPDAEVLEDDTLLFMVDDEHAFDSLKEKLQPGAEEAEEEEAGGEPGG